MLTFSKDELLTSILLIENIPNMGKILREMVYGMGFRTVDRVTNIIHAFQFIRSRRPALIIGEVNIAPVGCARLCKALRIAADSPGRTTPIILTLTEATPSAVSQARDCGANFVMAKPLSVLALETKIASVLRHPQPFVTASTYTGPERRRRDLPFSGDERRSEEIRMANYLHAAHAVLDVDADVLAGKVAPPPEMIMEDNERLLRMAPKQGTGRKILVTQLEEGMELAESVRGAGGTVIVPRGIALRNDLIAGLCRLVEQGRIGPLVRIG